MSLELLPNTQAILLLTAPLRVGRGGETAELLSASEYRRLARSLVVHGRQPADLLDGNVSAVLRTCGVSLDEARVERLLSRGFLLAQAVDHWRARSMWVLSRADASYPRRLKARLREDAPAVLYGCGDPSLLDTGGLAVVGSRDVDEAILEYTGSIGRLVAASQQTLVSGGARGVDHAAMQGGLQAGGRVVGILADSLERAAMHRDNRQGLQGGRLALVSPYDPYAGFNVGNAMQRNKLIYALADAALVVNSDVDRGGTWAGAIEQLEALRLVPVYVRSTGSVGKGLTALRARGALPWPNPVEPDTLVTTLRQPPQQGLESRDAGQRSLFGPTQQKPQ